MTEPDSSWLIAASPAQLSPSMSFTVGTGCPGHGAVHQPPHRGPRAARCAGFENVTAAARATAARALGITVPAWRTGQRAYFDLNPSGSIDTNLCVSMTYHFPHTDQSADLSRRVARIMFHRPH